VKTVFRAQILFIRPFIPAAMTAFELSVATTGARVITSGPRERLFQSQDPHNIRSLIAFVYQPGNDFHWKINVTKKGFPALT
jgi:hypothetical protein